MKEVLLRKLINFVLTVSQYSNFLYLKGRTKMFNKNRLKFIGIISIVLIFNIIAPLYVFASSDDSYDLLEDFMDIIIDKVYEIKEDDTDTYNDVDAQLRIYFKDTPGVKELSRDLELIIAGFGEDKKKKFYDKLDNEDIDIDDVKDAILILKDWSKSDRLVILDMIGADKSKSSVSDKLDDLIDEYKNAEESTIGSIMEVVPEEVAEVKFSDMESHWAEESVKKMASFGFIKGYDDGSFLPENSISKAEYTTLIVRLLGLNKEQLKPNNNFKDVATDSWYYDTVNMAFDKGIISGNTEQEFKPNEKITREEMVVMSVNALDSQGKTGAISDLQAKDSLLKYQDFNNVSESAIISFGKAVKLGLVKGRSETLLAPKETLTRAEATVILSRIHDLIMEK